MAFCNSCGAALTDGTKFCNKCGAATAAPPAPGMTAPPPSPPPTGGSSALKIILIIIAVVVGLGILSVGAFSFFVYHIAKSSHITQEGDHVKAETPFGSFESSKDPEQTAKDLGVDVYPGAQVQKNGTASVTLGNMHTVAANFESSDSVDKVCAFYKSKFPNSTVNTSDQNHCTIVSSDQKNMITINVQASGDTTKFQITSVSKKLASSN
jgi:flagellar basal body-associated protein FliL